MMSTSRDFYLGIDVGTGSARAGLFDSEGTMLGSATREIDMNRPKADFVEQSSDNIWSACCQSVKQAIKDAGVSPKDVKGIGFDATCSLVALDESDRPVTVSPSGDDRWNVIVWMDHRAIEQAERINATKHEVLRYVGGVISPEMESPKLLWLKENLRTTWKRAARFFDLPDFLVRRATGADSRSLCTTVCKWTYMGHEEATTEGSVGRWDESYWRTIGIEEFPEDGWAKIGRRVRPMGELAGEGLSATAAKELGLAPGTPVGVAIIDAHAGGLGLIGARFDGQTPTPETLEERLALIGGTSSCHMAVSREALFVPGIWGPYFSAMIPGMWLTEGGQSATGALVDHVIFAHARAADLKVQARSEGKTVYDLLNERLEALGKGAEFPAALTGERHVLPYFHGNRSPRADPTLRGVMTGLRLNDTVDELALQYLSTIQAIAYGTRHIIATMNENGYRIATIFACGGGTKNPVFLREHADATGCRIAMPKEPEAVLLGSAILGGVASGRFASVIEAMGAMNRVGAVVEPSKKNVLDYHTAKYRVFLRMYDDLMNYREMMKG